MTEPACEIPAYNPADDEIKKILSEYKVVAVVGISNKPDRDSFRVASFLKERGYKIVPVNPNYKDVLGEKCYPSLSSIPFPIEIVDIFRKPDAVPPIADEAVKIGAKAVWMQIGIVNNEAAEKLIKNGIKVVMNKCMMAEYNGFFPDFPDTTVENNGKESRRHLSSEKKFEIVKEVIVGKLPVSLVCKKHEVSTGPVSYTHLTLPTILRV